MQAIILAGGFGTRLQSVVNDVPKPMAPVCGKPFLSFILDELVENGFNKAVIAVGYKREVIMDYYKDEYKNMKIVYSIEDIPLGTGGCVRQAMQYIDEEYVFVLNGDTMFKIDFKKMSELNRIAIACKKMYNFNRYGEVKIDGNIITSFAEKKEIAEGYINGGIYYLPKNVFADFGLVSPFSLEKDFFEKYISLLKIQSFLCDDYFIDIGIPEDYKQVQIDFKKNKALFLDRDGIINVDYGHVHTIDKFVFTDFVFPLCRKYQDLGYLIIVVTNQAGIGKGLYTLEDFKILNNFMLEQFEKNNIHISKVYFCPHSPNEHCGCRKPKPGLFIKAIKEFNLEPENCIAIGDKIGDLEAANAVGIKELFFKKTSYEEYEVDFKYKRMD